MDIREAAAEDVPAIVHLLAVGTVDDVVVATLQLTFIPHLTQFKRPLR